jgi:hypothetical protein
MQIYSISGAIAAISLDSGDSHKYGRQDEFAKAVLLEIDLLIFFSFVSFPTEYCAKPIAEKIRAITQPKF